ncbi:hypothetical protein TELCIR_07486 [Teladorsagia circumcincta]|uniref:Uncharacterized protein n=1 Tax=Teladorsagia circumcincta TaxID=45464 RepID=A0A2G9UKI2_TELCI|nr:hypothetical protein TELCIR_07486 [Teladorsagia circumcincta]
MAIELAADLLRKVHYVGREIEDVAGTVVWFGGKKQPFRMTMRKLIRNLGDQFNVPEEELAKFDLNQFVNNAMKVEAGEIKTLRKPVCAFQGPLTYSKLRDSGESDIRYVDERLGKYYGEFKITLMA